MKLRIKFNYTFFFLFSWMSLLVYLLYFNFQAFVLFLILPIFFGSMLYYAVKKRYISLSIFLIFTFIAQAINPPFFFLNQERLLSSPQWKLGDFNFDLLDFLNLNKELYILIICIFVFYKYFLKKISKKVHIKESSFPKISSTNKPKSLNSSIKYSLSKYSIYLFVLILLFAIPLNIFMYNNGIGIATVNPERLPFKLVGITVYTRFFLIPSLIFYLYFKSKRSIIIVLLIIFYALFVSIISMSKVQGLLILLPVIIFSLLDNKKSRVAFVGLLGAFIYVVIGSIRSVSFDLNLNPFEIFQLIGTFISFNGFSIPGFLFEFSDRLYGSQYTILVNNFNLEYNIGETIKFLIGNTYSLSQIMTFDLFGLSEFAGRVIGVNIGIFNKILLLANKNYFLLIFLAYYVSMCLCIIEWISIKYSQFHDFGKVAGYCLSFIMVFYLYDGVIAKYYFLVFISLLGLLILNKFPIFSQNKYHKKQHD
jgi:hypothetical protein